MAMSQREKAFVDPVKRYFSNQGVHAWSESLRVKNLEIDLVAKDADDSHLLIEIKTKSCAKKRTNRSIANRDAAHKAIGQLLNYATAYMEQHQLSISDLRLISVVENHPETVSHSKTVNKICKFLRRQGIKMEHIRIETS